MDERRAGGWADLVESLYADSWREDIGRFRSNFVFRGLGLAQDELLTGLARLGGEAGELERHLLRNFRKYAVQKAAMSDSVWDWLALGQHHGLPTRLLDWTFSPLVALHFATQHVERFGDDGVVWCVDCLAARRHLPGPLLGALEEEGAVVFTTEMLARAAPRIADFDALAGKPFVAFLEPPSLDDRIVNQFALFSLMPGPESSLSAWLSARPELARRVVIPAGLKWEIRDKLDQANVTERVLCPGLDGLSQWLRRQYAPANQDRGAR